MKLISKVILLYLMTSKQAFTKEIVIPSDFGIDFHTSMKITNRYNPQAAEKNTGWRTAISLYNQHIKNDLQISAQPRIPTIIHQIWVGSPLPAKYQSLQATWISKNRDWIYILWTDHPHAISHNSKILKPRKLSDIEGMITVEGHIPNKVYIVDINNLIFPTRQHFNARTNYGEKADILRYEILYNLGGLYIDTDFECLKPFDIFHASCDFYAGVDFQSGYFLVFNGLIGAQKNHPILQQCIANILSQKPTISPHARVDDVMLRTGPHFLTKQILKHVSNAQDKVVLFPVTYFYPWPNLHLSENTEAQIRKWIRPESHAIHHWHTSWVK